MAREAVLHDGTVLEFPDDTPDDVIDRTVKNYLGGQQAPAAQQPKEAPQEAPQRSYGEETVRQLGLTSRYALEGIGQAVGVFTDPIALAVPGANMRMGELAAYGADKLGLPQPEGGLERVVGGAARAGFSTLPTMGAGGIAAQAPGLTGRVGKVVADSPFMQTLAAMSGGGSAETAKEMGVGPGGQVLAGLAGALAPATAAATTRGLVRGGEQGRKGVIQTIDEFSRAGAGSPTVGQASGSRISRGAEALLSRTPGSAGVMTRVSERQQAGMGARVDDVTTQMSPGANAEKAGRGIERGVTGPGGFMAGFRKQARALYDKVDTYIPPDSPIPVASTKRVLDSLASPTPGAAQTSRVLASNKVADLRDALDADLQASIAAAGRGELPYAAVKALRSRLGDLISDSTFSTDVPTKQLKQVYGALSDDLANAAKATGNPEALRAANRASTYYKTGLERQRVLEQVIDRNGGGEKIYRAAIQGTEDGATTLRAVMQSLPRDAQKQLSAAFVRRMGKATPGTQDGLGEGFSAERFLTSFNAISAQAKTAMFGRFGPKYMADIEAIAVAAANRRAGSKVFANPSKTTDGVVQAGTILGFAGSLLGGAAKTAATIGAGVGATYGMARVMTSPIAVGWLARQTNTPLAALPVQIARLKAEAQAAGDEDALAFAAALEEASVDNDTNNAGQ